MRPFRFLATVDEYPGFAELTSLARKAEAVGCSAFVLPDHLIGQYAPVPLLAMVARRAVKPGRRAAADRGEEAHRVGDVAGGSHQLLAVAYADRPGGGRSATSESTCTGAAGT